MSVQDVLIWGTLNNCAAQLMACNDVHQFTTNSKRKLVGRGNRSITTTYAFEWNKKTYIDDTQLSKYHIYYRENALRRPKSSLIHRE